MVLACSQAETRFFGESYWMPWDLVASTSSSGRGTHYSLLIAAAEYSGGTPWQSAFFSQLSLQASRLLDACSWKEMENCTDFCGQNAWTSLAWT